jgi:hypothetical protein
MTHLTARRNMVLSLLAVLAMAGCAPSLKGNDAGQGNAVPVTVATSGAPATVTTSAAPSTGTPDQSAVDQQVGSIDNQLNTIDGQLNAASAGLSTSEGDPSQ